MKRVGRRRGREWPTPSDERRATAAVLSTEQREGTGQGNRTKRETGRRQKAHGGSSLGFDGLAGREFLVRITTATQKQKPENPRLSGIFCLCMSNRNNRQPANQKAINTDVADWPALWYPENREVPQRSFPDGARYFCVASNPQ